MRIDYFVLDFRDWIYYNVVDAEYKIPMLIYRYCVTQCDGITRLQSVFMEVDPAFTVELETTDNYAILLLKVRA